MNLEDGSENFRIISSRSQLKSDCSIRNAGINRLTNSVDRVSQFGVVDTGLPDRQLTLLSMGNAPLVTLVFLKVEGYNLVTSGILMCFLKKWHKFSNSGLL